METAAAALFSPDRPFNAGAEVFVREPWGQLGQLTQGLVDIVERVLKTDESMRSDAYGILKCLKKSLQRASDLVELACRSKIYRALRADRIRSEYNDVTLRLRICLNGLDSMLSTRQGKFVIETRGDVKRLQEDFGGTLFPKDGEEMRFCVETHNTASKIFSREISARRGSVALRKVMLDAFDENQIKNEWPATSRQLFKDMDDARDQKNHEEEHFIRHILIALEILQNTQTLKEERLAKSQKGTPPEFYCPLSLCIMKEPVVLFETAVTYEKSSIEKWLKGYGDGTCPVSQTKLSSRSFVENKALKSVIDDWMRNHGDSEDDSDSSFDSCVSTLGDDSAFLEGAHRKQVKQQDTNCFMPIDMEWTSTELTDARDGAFQNNQKEKANIFDPQPILWDVDCEVLELESNDVSEGTWGVIDDLFLD
ncbi:hypothetical protein BSKO_05118 [Bryopsis sp. KO-2023]|nr:hypothetical protein BSKO_05118 [Bryopsis sp. KO-2023]